MKKLIRNIVNRTYRPFLVNYLSSDRRFKYKNVHVYIPAGVFHPGFFFSTKMLLSVLNNISMANKTFLEPGAGSGLISICMAKKGAKVTATDISDIAVSCIRRNAKENDVTVEIIHSDLFEKITFQLYDVIAINPPYYKKKPESSADFAWYCGEHGEYFATLFSQLNSYIHKDSIVLMALCENVDSTMVFEYAAKFGFHPELVQTKKNVLETNFIYSLVSEKNADSNIK
ncbi:MAG TPA: HemK2/MTQ2 family protein methyltransferase [Flavitalea sp.]|nr:HemK2/MTQ2 family protein methyltransferase [Flavitalea sp.]